MQHHSPNHPWNKETKPLQPARSIGPLASHVTTNDNDFNGRYPGVVEALKKMPKHTVVDGEIVAFEQEGRPSFNTLQNYGSSPTPVVYYVFDVMVLGGRDLRHERLDKRRELLEAEVPPRLPEPVRYSPPLDADLPVLIESVKATASKDSSPSDARAFTKAGYEPAHG